MAFTGEDIMIYIFVVFLALLAINSVKLQKIINEKQEIV